MIDIENIVKDIIAKKFYILRKKIFKKLKIINDLGADSLDLMELYMILENTFHINFPEKEISKIISISDLIKYIKKNIKN